jgi:hypothetical protein
MAWVVRSIGRLWHGRAIGSLPSTALTVWILSYFDIGGSQARRAISFLLGAALLATAIALVLRPWLIARLPEIDIWRAATLMLKRYGEKALEESVARADELFTEQDHDGAAVWRRIIDAVSQLANTTPSGRLH